VNEKSKFKAKKIGLYSIISVAYTEEAVGSLIAGLSLFNHNIFGATLGAVMYAGAVFAGHVSYKLLKKTKQEEYDYIDRQNLYARLQKANEKLEKTGENLDKIQEDLLKTNENLDDLHASLLENNLKIKLTSNQPVNLTMIVIEPNTIKEAIKEKMKEEEVTLHHRLYDHLRDYEKLRN